MKKIPLTQGQFTLVDDQDFDWLTKWSWCAAWDPRVRQFRAHRGEWRNGKRRCVRMHRQILEFPKSYIDHINGITLDNQRSNLRLCTPAQNAHNSKKRINNQSGFKGVCWKKRNKRWVAQIRFKNKNFHLGYFQSPQEAARAYNKVALELQGQFVHAN